MGSINGHYGSYTCWISSCTYADDEHGVPNYRNKSLFLIADLVHPLFVQHDRGERHNIRQTSA